MLSHTSLVSQRRAAVIVAVKHPRATHHKHKRQPIVHKRLQKDGHQGMDTTEAATEEPPAEEHVHGLKKLALDLKSWLYAWTETGYEPL